MLWLSLYIFLFLSSEITVHSTTRTKYQENLISNPSEQLKTVAEYETKNFTTVPVIEKADTRYTDRQSYESILLSSVKPLSRKVPTIFKTTKLNLIAFNFCKA